ncbi:MAG: AsnC family transcriptional regulator [Candidatus Thorarchaeota archaeon]
MATVRTGNLDLKDYLILLTLKQQPRLSNAKIAERVGVAPETVRLRVRALKERKILRPDRRINDPLIGERTQTEIEAAYLPSRLGLVRHHVLFSEIDTRDKLNALKQLCDVHPHTHYRVVAFGRCAALYTQFDLPPRGESTIKKCKVYARGLKIRFRWGGRLGAMGHKEK